MRIIARSHPCGTYGSSTSAAGASPTRAYTLSYISTASTAAASSTSLSFSAFPVDAAAVAATGANDSAVAAPPTCFPLTSSAKGKGNRGPT